MDDKSNAFFSPHVQRHICVFLLWGHFLLLICASFQPTRTNWGALETSAAADRVTLLVAHPMFPPIDCASACRGYNKPAALPPAPLVKWRHVHPPELRSLYPHHFFAPFHWGTEVRWRPGLPAADAENSLSAGRTKSLSGRSKPSELDTSTEVWSRVFVSLRRWRGADEVMVGVRRRWTVCLYLSSGTKQRRKEKELEGLSPIVTTSRPAFVIIFLLVRSGTGVRNLLT